MTGNEAKPGDSLSDQNAEAFLAAITASSNDAIISKDLAGLVTFWNPAAERLFGFSAQEMVGQPITRIIPPEHLAEEASILARVHDGELISHLETERRTKNGGTIPVSLRISPIRGRSGEIIGSAKVARDLSETQQLLRELKQRQALLLSVLDTVPDGIIVISDRGTIQHFSAAAAGMFGYHAREVIGRNVSHLMPAPDSAAHDSYLSHYLATGERRIIGIGRVVVGLRKNGTTFPMELQIGEVTTGEVRYFTGFVKDLTAHHAADRRMNELQAELIHVARLSELGQMVSTLAHEVSQPLAAISNYANGLRRLLADDNRATLREAVDKIAAQSERARGIIKTVRGFIRKESAPHSIESVETLVLEASAIALMGSVHAVAFEVETAADARYAFVDKVQIQQVLLNLIRNSAEAMEGMVTRRLTVTSRRRGEQVEIGISDTGPGMPAMVMQRLFEPFLTTKPDGLGVGLSICRTIVEAHDGTIVVESGQTGGTLIRFTVPAPPEAPT